MLAEKMVNVSFQGPTLVHEVTLFHFDSMLKMMGQVEKKQKEIKAPLMVMCE